MQAIQLDIPFVANNAEGNACAQASSASVLNYFFPGRNYTTDELDELMGRKPGKWTWTSQIVLALHNEGLSVRFFSKGPLLSIDESWVYFAEQGFSEADIAVMKKHTDEKVVEKSIQIVFSKGLFTQKSCDMSDLHQWMADGWIPIVTIDWSVLRGKDDVFEGHFVVITGITDEEIIFHENTTAMPTPHERMPLDRFLPAWQRGDCDVIFSRKD